VRHPRCQPPSRLVLREAMFGRVGGLADVDGRKCTRLLDALTGEFDDIDVVSARGTPLRHPGTVSAARSDNKRLGMIQAVCATFVQRIPRNAASIDLDRLRGVKTDPDFPRSAAIGFHSSQLEGLAVARPWGFESPIPHKPLTAKKERVCQRVARARRAQRLVSYLRRCGVAMIAQAGALSALS
jgi:hypothetical protein